jgi:O-acetylserine/cysteine efflux transporter
MRTDRRAILALTIAGILWGTTVPLSKIALEWLPPAWLTAIRFAVAAAALVAIAGPGRVRQACRPAIIAAGAAGYGGSVLLQNIGITRTSVSDAALLVGAVPVLVAVIAALWQRSVARPVAWAGFALSLAGVGLVTGSHAAGSSPDGNALVLASVLISAVFTVGQTRLLAGRDPVAVTAVQFLGAALAALPAAVLTEGTPSAPGHLSAFAAVAALAACGTLAPFTLFAYGQSRVPAEIAGAFVNIEPVVGALAGVLLFGNPATAGLAVGGVAILAGIAMSSRPARSRAPASPAGSGRGAPRTDGPHGNGRAIPSASDRPIRCGHAGAVVARNDRGAGAERGRGPDRDRDQGQRPAAGRHAGGAAWQFGGGAAGSPARHHGDRRRVRDRAGRRPPAQRGRGGPGQRHRALRRARRDGDRLAGVRPAAADLRPHGGPGDDAPRGVAGRHGDGRAGG